MWSGAVVCLVTVFFHLHNTPLTSTCGKTCVYVKKRRVKKRVANGTWLVSNGCLWVSAATIASSSSSHSLSPRRLSASTLTHVMWKMSRGVYDAVLTLETDAPTSCTACLDRVSTPSLPSSSLSLYVPALLCFALSMAVQNVYTCMFLLYQIVKESSICRCRVRVCDHPYRSRPLRAEHHPSQMQHH